MYKKFIKRLIDITLSFIGIIVLSPVFLITAIMIKIDSKGPILFKQKRIGINKTQFNILKFRSMYVTTPKDCPTHLLSSANSYITKVGEFMRKTSLDELPQMFNIFTGKMSIIGPRPALWNQYDLIAERDKYGANNIKPGLTGWAQINGRDTIKITDKARYDGEYVKKLSFSFDCKCFFGTIVSVIKSDGVLEGSTDASKKEEETKIKESGEMK
ncbi:MAG: sugar transferase [Lachnospiraceae bacterium]